MIVKQILLTMSPLNHTLQSWELRKWSPGKKPFDWQTKSPCQHLRKCVKNSKENMHTDVRWKELRCEWDLFLYLHVHLLTQWCKEEAIPDSGPTCGVSQQWTERPSPKWNPFSLLHKWKSSSYNWQIWTKQRLCKEG